jgi:magnesium chelatase subunit D
VSRDAPVPAPWSDAVLAAALFAVDPAGTGGISVRSPAGPVRDQWLASLRAALPQGAPWCRLPVHTSDGRLLGGLDLAATLRAGRPVAERGLLSAADGGVLVAAMAERMSSVTAAHLVAAIDSGEVLLERDGLAMRIPARFGVIALDEGVAADEVPPAALLDRLAFHVDLTPVGPRDMADAALDAESVAAARLLAPDVELGDDLLESLCAAALALGIGSVRAVLQAIRVARAAAALGGRNAVALEDATLAGRLVFASRATMLPAEEPPADAEPPEQDEQPTNDSTSDDEPDDDPADDLDRPLDDTVLAAIAASLPPGLLASLRAAGAPRRPASSVGRSGTLQQARLRGRPAGIRRGDPRTGARLNVIETLRAAAPWQPLRRRARVEPNASSRSVRPRIEIRHDDFRITRFRQRTQTTTLFVVDASGSSALHRLGEAKGAVELLLADCYVRRDRVALIAFRGRTAELLLPPTRSLVRAKRSLAALPGGGGTPLATGIDAATELGESLKRRGDTPLLVFLCDGGANIARDGSPGRERAADDAIAAAHRLQAAGLAALVIDTSPRTHPLAQRLAREMGGRYLPLPRADAMALSRAVGVGVASGRRGVVA